MADAFIVIPTFFVVVFALLEIFCDKSNGEKCLWTQWFGEKEDDLT